MTSDNLVRIGVLKCSLIPRMRVFSNKTKQDETKEPENSDNKNRLEYLILGMGSGMEGWIRSSFSSDLVWGVHARTSVETTRRARETRAAVSPFQSRTRSLAFLASFARQTNQQSGISLNLRTGPNGHATLFNQVEGAFVFIKTSTKWSKIFTTADGVAQILR